MVGKSPGAGHDPSVSRPRSIEPLLAARFVGEYVGEQGRAFRQAMADHFGVDKRTVERELPRLVASRVLEEYVLPGRGAPKGYRVPARPKPKGRTEWRRVVDSDPGGGRARKPGYILAAESKGVTPEEFLASFRKGIAAFCARCGRAEVVWPDWPTPDCPVHGRMERAVGFPIEAEPPPPCWCGRSFAAHEPGDYALHRRELASDPGLADPAERARRRELNRARLGT